MYGLVKWILFDNITKLYGLQTCHYKASYQGQGGMALRAITDRPYKKNIKESQSQSPETLESILIYDIYNFAVAL
jgi:hypothetical protein